VGNQILIFHKGNYVERGMINFNISFFHNGFKVTIRDILPDVEKNSVGNNILWKVSAFKANHRIFQLLKLVSYRSN